MDPVVFSCDPYVVGFIKGNIVSLGMGLVMLKGIAKMTPTVYDDKIATLLGRMVGLGKPLPAAKAAKEA